MTKPRIPDKIDSSNVLDLLEQCPELFDQVLKDNRPKSRSRQLGAWKAQLANVDLGYWDLRRSGNSGEIYLFCPSEKAMYVDEITRDKDKIHYGEPYFVNTEGFELWMMYGGFGKRKFIADKSKKRTGLNKKYQTLKESTK